MANILMKAVSPAFSEIGIISAMVDLMKKLRIILYNISLELGLFYLMPIAIRLPAPLSKLLLKLKTGTRFLLGNYKAYVNRPGLKKIAIRNLSDTLGIDKRSAAMKLYRLMQLEVFAERNGFLLDTYTVSRLEDRFTIHGLKILENELQKRKGVIFATVHSGDTLLLMLFLSLKGYKIYGLFDREIQYRDAQNPLEKLARLKDEKITGKIGKLYAGKGMMGLFDVLRENGIIVWMVDLPALDTKRKTIVNFLGRNVAVNNSFWEIAAKTGASLLPHINLYDHRDDRHVIHIGPPVDFTKNTIQELFYFYESFIRESPESWIGWYMFDMLMVSV